jgi:hypothetical protein
VVRADFTYTCEFLERSWEGALTRQNRYAFVLTAALVCALISIGRADVGIEGTPAAVRVTTSDGDTISSTLSRFAETFNIKYRTTVPLDAPKPGATYLGSFEQVLSRLLEGYDYVIRTEEKTKTIEIMVIGTRGVVAVPQAAVPAVKLNEAHVTGKANTFDAIGAAAMERQAERKRIQRAAIARDSTNGVAGP